jgi:hypothetical protein
MPRLPQPSTNSPGFLLLIYKNGIINHKVGQRLLAGVDPTDTATLKAEADTWAGFLGPAMMNVNVITDFEIQDADRIELFSGPLSAAVNGSNAHSAAIGSESCTFDLVGRGAPGGGLAQGNTRHMWFPGAIWTDWPGPQQTTLDSSEQALRGFLNASALIGADKYGSKAIFRNVVDQQVNAHYQKRYGF